MYMEATLEKRAHAPLKVITLVRTPGANSTSKHDNVIRQMKIVVKVPMHCGRCRTKALKIAAAAHGVSKVSIEGANEDHVEVIGDGVDSVCLARSLRKKFGCSCTLVKVEEVKPADKPEKKPPPTPPACSAPSPSCVQKCCATQFRPMYCELVHEYPEPTTCSIM